MERPGSADNDILFLADQVPLPAEHGRAARSYQILRWLARHRRVHLVSLARDVRHLNGKDVLKEITRTRAIFRQTTPTTGAVARSFLMRRPMTFTQTHNDDVRQALTGLLVQRRIGTIFATSPAIAQHLTTSALRRAVVDFQDGHALAAADDGGRIERWLVSHERQRLLRAERRLMRTVRAGLFADEAQAALIDDAGSGGRRHVIRDGVDIEFFDPGVAVGQSGSGTSIVFAAPMNVKANEEAAIWFASRILPVLRERHRNVVFSIVGERPSLAVKELRLLYEGVRVIGAVRDVRSWLAGASIVVVPLRSTGATGAALLPGMAMARPIVASPAAVEGYDVNGCVRVADGLAMIDALSELIADPAASAALGIAARERASRFSWEWQLAHLSREFGLSGSGG